MNHMTNKPCFIIAELSANHQGDINVAIETIRAAKRTGADAVKLQTYTADTITLDVKNKHFQDKPRYSLGWSLFTRFIQRGLYTLGMA